MPSSQKFQSRTLRVAGIDTHFLEAGGGPDLVLLHGGEYGASAKATWGPVIGSLASDFHVVAPDMLGFGRTEKIYSFSDPAGYRIRHLQRLLEHLRIGEAYFVGNSAGGGTLLRASVLEPTPFRLKKIITICGNAGIFKTQSQAALESYEPSLENMRKLMKLLFHDHKWLTEESVRERYQNSVMPGAWEALSAARLRRPGYERASTTERFVQQLARITVPLLIISCAHDPLNQPDWDTSLQSMVQTAQCYRFEHSAHEPQIEEADLFEKVVKDFLLS